MRQACRHRALVYVLFGPNGYRISEFPKALKVEKFRVVVLPRLVWVEPIKARPGKIGNGFLRPTKKKLCGLDPPPLPRKNAQQCYEATLGFLRIHFGSRYKTSVSAASIVHRPDR